MAQGKWGTKGLPRIPAQVGWGHTLDEVVLRDEEACGPEAHQRQKLQEPVPAGQVTSVGQSPWQPHPRAAPSQDTLSQPHGPSSPIVELRTAVRAGAHVEQQGSLCQVEAGSAKTDPVHGRGAHQLLAVCAPRQVLAQHH